MLISKLHLFLLTTLVSFNLAAQDAIQVKVKPFSEIAQNHNYQFPGRVINLQLADIAAETSGRILSYQVQVGDTVKSDQLLVTLDCSSAKINKERMIAGLKRLKAKKQLTQQQLKRARGLVSSKSISRDELDQRQTQLNADNASIDEQNALLKAANKAVSDCQIKAPFDGIVIEKMSSSGSYASPGSPLLKLLKDNAVELELEIPVNHIPTLQRAKNIQFESHNKTYVVKLRSILPTLNGNSLMQRIRLSFESEHKPAGGSYGLAMFSSAKTYLPAEYVQKRDDHFGVFIVRNQQAHFLALPNAEEGQSVKTSLEPNTQVIIDNLKRIQHQDSIEIVAD